MTKRLGRNDRCWCGSGEKYKKCHLDRQREKPLTRGALAAQSRPFFRSKQCLHPQASPKACGKIISAHTIQRQGALQGIVDETGHVLSFYPPHPKGAEPRRVGWREASTFSGFCQRHDNETFRPLEQSAFVGTDEQCFLLAYRAQCHEFYQKLASARSNEQLLHLVDRGMAPEQQYSTQASTRAFSDGVKQGLDDAAKQKSRMDAELSTDAYSSWKRLFISFEGPICVVSTGVPTPNRNFMGDELQRLHDFRCRIQPLYFGPVKTKRGGVWVFAWRPEDDAPRRFLDDFRRIPRKALPGWLVQFMFAYVENTFFAADWWASLDSSIQAHIGSLARMANPYYGGWDYRSSVSVPWRITTVEEEYAGT